MPQGIDKADWDDVHQIACDIANAAMAEDDVLMASRKAAMLGRLSELERKYGDHPSLLATIADYLDDPRRRRAQFLRALSVANRQGNQGEIAEIEDSLRLLDEEDGV